MRFCIACGTNTSIDPEQKAIRDTGKADNRQFRKGLLDKTRYFDEHLELQFVELKLHEGRRARMGAMMMAPDYAWWHGFYEVKSRFNEFNEEADHFLKTGEKAYVYPNYPNATGSTQKPTAVFPKKCPAPSNAARQEKFPALVADLRTGKRQASIA